MATELTQLVAGALTAVRRGKLDGVTVRDVIPTRLVGDDLSRLRSRPARRVHGTPRRALPFDQFGSLITDAPLEFARVAKSGALRRHTDHRPRSGQRFDEAARTVTQGFGDSVTPSSWSGVWLDECNATYTYAARNGLPHGRHWRRARHLSDEGLVRAGRPIRATYGPVGVPRGLAAEFLRRGWSVIGTVRSSHNELETLADGTAGTLRIEHLDVTKARQIVALRGRLASVRLDVVFVNAGSPTTTSPQPISTTRLSTTS